MTANLKTATEALAYVCHYYKIQTGNPQADMLNIVTVCSEALDKINAAVREEDEKLAAHRKLYSNENSLKIASMMREFNETGTRPDAPSVPRIPVKPEPLEKSPIPSNPAETYKFGEKIIDPVAPTAIICLWGIVIFGALALGYYY